MLPLIRSATTNSENNELSPDTTEITFVSFSIRCRVSVDKSKPIAEIRQALICDWSLIPGIGHRSGR